MKLENKFKYMEYKIKIYRINDLKMLIIKDLKIKYYKDLKI